MRHINFEDLVPIKAYLSISFTANPSIKVEIEVPRWGEAWNVEVIRMAHGSRLVADKGYAAVEMVLKGDVRDTMKWKTGWERNGGRCKVERIVL